MTKNGVRELKSQTKELNEVFLRTSIGPMKKGRGVMFGNVVRRLLMTEIYGLSIVGVWVEGVSHEFSAPKLVKEEMLDIMLNLKQIVLRGSVEEDTIVKLEYCGPGIITAKDICLPENIEVFSPEQYIATALSNRVVRMEFIIRAGAGYRVRHKVPVSRRFIPIDAVFMPVTRVNFFVETLLTEIPYREFEVLIFEVSTNGSLTSREAINLGLRKAIDYFEGLLCDVMVEDFGLNSGKFLPREK